MNTKTYLAGVALATAFASAVAVVPAFAATTGSMMGGGAFGARTGMMRQGVAGSVTTISGTTLTVQNSRTNTPYTVDASKAVVTKDKATSSVSAIVVGDTVLVQGTVSGTSVAATKIFDGKFVPGAIRQKITSAVSAFKGNGQPVIAGTVSAVSGSTITITNSGSASYTIDASSATVTKRGAASTVSAIAVGDHVVAQGTINGTSVVATSVIDQAAPPAAQNGMGTAPARQGFLGSIGRLFKGMFGF